MLPNNAKHLKFGIWFILAAPQIIAIHRILTKTVFTLIHNLLHIRLVLRTWSHIILNSLWLNQFTEPVLQAQLQLPFKRVQIHTHLLLDILKLLFILLQQHRTRPLSCSFLNCDISRFFRNGEIFLLPVCLDCFFLNKICVILLIE